MDSEIDALMARLRRLEDELEKHIEARRAAFHYRLERNRVVFEREVAARHRRLRMGLLRFLRESQFGALLISPAVYLVIVPLALLDLAVALFQLCCFPVWGIPRVRRSDYVVIDRQHLAYLNAVQKLNCVYCGYANGLIALVREVASRTEQYWCPIKHAMRVRGAHRRYRHFLDYGDADGFRDRLERIRDELRES